MVSPEAATPNGFLPTVGMPLSLAPSLANTIEGEVIPRLMMALKSATPAKPSVHAAATYGRAFTPRPDQITELVHLALGDDDRARQFVDNLCASGMSLETIYLELLTPAARELGNMWVEDTCTFSDVTIGMGRLHQIVRHHSNAFRMGTSLLKERATSEDLVSPGSLLIAPVAGERHTFGCVVVEDFFRRDRWDVCGWPTSSDNDLAELVDCDYFDVVGLSVSCDINVGRLQRLIAKLKRASCNRQIAIMVGGRAFNDKPGLATSVGADLTAANGRDAVAAARMVLARRATAAQAC